MAKEEEDEEPLSPMARVFQSPGVDYCAVTILGFKTKIKPQVVLDALKHNVSKHPRFSSKLSDNGAKWIETEVNVEDHVVVPFIDPEDIAEDGDGFVDDYISRLTMVPLDRSRPLWDIHILNVQTSDAEAVDPDAISTANPSMKRRETVSHGLRNKDWFQRLDTKTPLKGGADVGSNPKRFYHRIVSLDDIKLIKNAMNMTINDVLLGVTQASLSRYLNRLYEKKNEVDGALASNQNHLPGRLRFRAGCTVNLRSDIGFKPLADMMAKDSKCGWGNYFSFIILPFSIGLQTDPLDYLKISKSTMARKKHSYHAALVYLIIKIVLKVLGVKVAATLFNRPVMNITTCVSNVIGPMEEISFRGHPIAYIAPSSYGHSQTLLIHYISYGKKMIISIAVDPTVIPNPHNICDEMEESLKAMKC
ncbi:hypothetical protein AALP_AA8G125200 [Arabis alpina]|uniref:O-acyltransferase WSD1 C-terminal domain-containing protein n=1 Tax=Arabis alpina TaxID=50452 RepID=A0A087G6L5_ARAAL|nr:hypothetical protein AALP_AA8G125200 [Arabis alpina]